MLQSGIECTTATTGTGTFDLAAPLDPLRVSFVSGIGSGGTVFYRAEVTGGSAWEEGWGTVAAGSPDTLTRNVMRSSNGNALVNFSAGTKRIYCAGLGDALRFGSVGAVPTAGGTANALALTHLPALRVRRPGMVVRFIAAGTNTGNATLAVDGLGADPLRRADASEIPPGLLYSGLAVAATWDGTQWRCGAEVATGAVLLPGSGSFSAVSQFDVLLPAAFSVFEFDLHVFMATDVAGVELRTSTNGGSSYDAGASDYQTQASYTSAAAVWTAGVGAASPSIGLMPGLDNAANSSAMVRGVIFPGDGARYPRVNASTGGAFDVGGGGFQGVSIHSGVRLSGTRINAIRLRPGTGTMTGRVAVRGLI